MVGKLSTATAPTPNWAKIAGVSDTGAPQLGNGEYRTVLAQQRTFLAFVRTALAVTAAFNTHWAGAVLGLVVLAVGAFQYSWVLPLFLSQRSGGQVDAHLLFLRSRIDAFIILVLMLGIGTASVIYRWRDSGDEGIDSVAVGALDMVA